VIKGSSGLASALAVRGGRKAFSSEHGKDEPLVERGKKTAFIKKKPCMQIPLGEKASLGRGTFDPRAASTKS